MRRKPLRACMLAYTFYENDGRVMRYAEALAGEGAEVDAIVLRRPGQQRTDVANSVRLVRLQERTKNESGRASHLARLVAFFLRSMIEVTRRHWSSPYDIIHVHSVPDFEVFAAIVPKLQGARIILDIHDIVPELYAAKFGNGKDALVFKALAAVERWSAGFADHVIIANDLWFDRITSRSTTRERCSVFLNYPDLTIFRPSLRTRVDDGRFIITYPGTLNWHQGLDIAIKAVGIARTRTPAVELHIYGEGPAKPELRRLVDELGLESCVRLTEPMPIHAIATVMANSDLGVVPKRDDYFGGEAFSTKILEFMALGIPLVIADTRIDRLYFDESMLRFFSAGNEQSLAAAMVDAYSNREVSFERAARAQAFVAERSWGRKKVEYLDLVRRLTRANG